MEITSVKQTGVSKISETLKIKYSLVLDQNEKTKSFTGQIIKDEEIIGFCNASSDGVAGLSLNDGNNLTNEEFSAVATQFVADRNKAFA